MLLSCLLFCFLQQGKAQLTRDVTVGSCSIGEYFDSTQLSCELCPSSDTSKLVPTANKRGCECAPGYKQIESSLGDFYPICTACGPNEGVSLDKSTCMPCSGGAEFDTNLQDCRCPDNYVVHERDVAGNLMAQKECRTCIQEAYQGPSNYTVTECQRCPVEGMIYDQNTYPYSCVCGVNKGYVQAGDVCFLQSETTFFTASSGSYSSNTAKQISYEKIETMNLQTGEYQLSSVPVSSGTFDYLYLKSAMGCRDYNDPKACQVLANLCVLQLYKMTTPVCSLYQELVASRTQLAYPDFYPDEGFKKGMPWLYYKTPADEVIFKENRVKFRASFDYENLDIGIVRQLRFKVAKYDLEGNFYGFEDLTNQLVICEKTQDELQRIYRIGTTVEILCTFDLGRLVSSNKYDLVKNANMFYELYLLDYNGNMIDVPTLISNVVSDTGNTPNGQNDSSKWILTRRFFIFDTKSGIKDGEYPDGVPQVVRYPKTMTLKVQLDQREGNEEMISVPYLFIEYRERTASYINENQDNALTELSFNTEYLQNTFAFWKGAKTFFWISIGIFVVLVILISCLQNSGPSLNNEFDAHISFIVVKFFVNSIDMFSTLFFWYIFAMTGYWFVFFKLQERVYCFLPGLNTYYENYYRYDWLFGWVCGAKLVYVLYKIYFDQCSMDVFLIDWERPKTQQHTFINKKKKTFDSANPVGDELDSSDFKQTMDVNAWRSLFLVNELNELQGYRLISMEFTLFAYAILMEGFGLKYWITHDPDLNLTENNSPRNFTLFFFVTTLVIYGVGVAQYAFAYIMSNTNALKTLDFVDLCSICNISVLMFDESFSGYYIHGRSPFGQAEISSSALRQALEFEKTGKAQIRGISEEAQDMQTFEIYITRTLLEHYKRTYLKEVNSKIQDQNIANQKFLSSSQKFLQRLPAVPQGIDLSNLDDLRKMMTKMMQSHLELVKKEPKRYIRDRHVIQRLLNIAPTEELKEKAKTPIMYKDKWASFGNTFLMGMDFDFLMLDVCVLSFIEQTARFNTGVESKIMLGVLVTYILDSILVYMRKYFGRRNLAKHTMVDEAFLI